MKKFQNFIVGLPLVGCLVIVLTGCTSPPVKPRPSPSPTSTPASSTNALPELVQIDTSGVKHPAVLGQWLEIDRTMGSSPPFLQYTSDPFELFIRDADGVIDPTAKILATLSHQEYRHTSPAGPTGPEQDSTLEPLPIYRVEVGNPLKFSGYTDSLNNKGEPVLTNKGYFQVDATQSKTVGVETEITGDCQNGKATSKPGGQPAKLEVTRQLRAEPGLAHKPGTCSLRIRLCALPGPLQNEENACK